MECMMCGKETENDEMCNLCVAQNKKDDELIEKFMESGHPYHCANRQVYGDGECECDLYKQGYDPYLWMKPYIK